MRFCGSLPLYSLSFTTNPLFSRCIQSCSPFPSPGSLILSYPIFPHILPSPSNSHYHPRMRHVSPATELRLGKRQARTARVKILFSAFDSCSHPSDCIFFLPLYLSSYCSIKRIGILQNMPGEAKSAAATDGHSTLKGQVGQEGKMGKDG